MEQLDLSAPPQRKWVSLIEGVRILMRLEDQGDRFAALVRALEGRAAAAPRAATLRGGAAAPEGAAVGPQPDANAHTRLGAVA